MTPFSRQSESTFLEDARKLALTPGPKKQKKNGSAAAVHSIDEDE